MSECVDRFGGKKIGCMMNEEKKLWIRGSSIYTPGGEGCLKHARVPITFWKHVSQSQRDASCRHRLVVYEFWEAMRSSEQRQIIVASYLTF